MTVFPNGTPPLHQVTSSFKFGFVSERGPVGQGDALGFVADSPSASLAGLLAALCL